MCWVRTVSLSMVVGLSIAGVQSQGTLTFLNTWPATGTAEGAPVTDIDGVTRLDGQDYFAQLYASPINEEGSLFPIGVPVPFRTGVAAGFVSATQVAVPDAPEGSYVFVQMRAWENSAGNIVTYETALASGLKTGKSGIIYVGLLGPLSIFNPMDPNLVGLQPFSLIPEPSPTLLALLGGLLVVAVRRGRRMHAATSRSESHHGDEIRFHVSSSGVRFFCVSLTLLTVPGTSNAIAQGTLAFGNSGSFTETPGGAPVTDVDGLTRLAGGGFFAQLYASPVSNEAFLLPIGIPVPFRTGAAAGFVVPSEVAVPGSPRLSYVFVQMRSWDNSGGTVLSYEAAIASGLRTGKSNTIQVGPLGPFPFGPLGDPNLVGLQPFSLIPEPSSMLLALLGGLLVVAVRRGRRMHAAASRSKAPRGRDSPQRTQRTQRGRRREFSAFFACFVVVPDSPPGVPRFSGVFYDMPRSARLNSTAYEPLYHDLCADLSSGMGSISSPGSG